MKKILYTLLLLLIILGCTKKYRFWEIDKFNIIENGLEDNEEVSVIYYSRGPLNKKSQDQFYTHAIVISSISNDTLNILTFPNFDLDNVSSGNNILVYNDHPVIEKLIPNLEDFPEDMQEKIDAIDAKKVSWGTYHKVARDPEFDKIADNNFRTVIGSLTKK
ncbi:MAG: hypothetical protein HOD63_17355 [Bacteroidetes bacterium]|mgnify:FL=1|jgi:hypothetical protein|nr:hypothetical protein [Bacteroidota bacterium]MBT5530029.1 hypothetical protein [Cytophagia bacterium]MBT3934967.1 hypothetical protein [Bacteroidota bacterium]MBT4340361.1 hypothetical protein [Bacteroidota bacterium]MBT4727152.1 hypothetical protein [Bacteroidota bacterium]